jgi:hypothetical protein
VLAVSRAFGDIEHKVLKERYLEHAFAADPLIVAPDIRVHTVRPRDEFLILACDGLWDVLSTQQAVNFVRRKLRDPAVAGDVQRAAELLVQKAIALSSVDNVSAFVIALGQPPGAPLSAYGLGIDDGGGADDDDDGGGGAYGGGEDEGLQHHGAYDSDPDLADGDEIVEEF